MKQLSSNSRLLGLGILATLLLFLAIFTINSQVRGSAVNSDDDAILDTADLDDDNDHIPTAVEDTNRDGNPTNDDADGDLIANYLDSADCTINDIDFAQQWIYDYSTFTGAGDNSLELFLRMPSGDTTVTMATNLSHGFVGTSNADTHGNPSVAIYQIDQNITLTFSQVISEQVSVDIKHNGGINRFAAGVAAPLPYSSTVNGVTTHYSSLTMVDAVSVTQSVGVTMTVTTVQLSIDRVADGNFDANDPSSAGQTLLSIANVNRDSDGDTIPDHVDLDDDHDGLLDTVENQYVSGVCDSDNDGLPDNRDSDSDGDGASDNIEAQAADSYIAPLNQDLNGNGVDDAYDSAASRAADASVAAALVPVNSDLTDFPDYVDTDANNDGTADNIELGLGTASGSDADGDGIDDAFDDVNEPLMGTSVASIQNNVSDPSSLDDWQTPSYDYGDLPDSFGTTLANNGAGHTVGPLYLGSAVDGEADGAPSDSATGDSTDDGVTVVRLSRASQVELTINVTGGSGEVGIWIDWDKNNAFESDEFASAAVNAGNNAVVLDYPAGISDMPENAAIRVRLFEVGNAPGGTLDAADYVGIAGNGEVEDYILTVPTAVSLGQLTVRTNTLLTVTVALLAFVTLAMVTRRLKLMPNFLRRE